MNFGGRLLRGLVFAVVFGALGWIGSRLTVGMVLSRHFNSSQKHLVERVLPFVWVAAGFLTGMGLDRRAFANGSLRPVCWGAVAGLTLVMLCVRLLMWIDPMQKFSPVAPFAVRLDWETIGLISSPMALVAGGIVGRVFHWYFGRQRGVPVEEPELD